MKPLPIMPMRRLAISALAFMSIAPIAQSPGQQQAPGRPAQDGGNIARSRRH
jgi:hypothetical protein